ncbi:rhamnogalacturonan acetylesterase [Opitutus sp. ER46]|uniref:rhamnogalacturonan acetylesterase n=1 Tax=Opitutus sp. ER46 TaxID=2161864 RepID=UPI000D312421|nr:rhamnogalacturonan acetylesterase [Opitutus sp. ER46]PTX98948.1 GDSL family lipase [Opitutus sp. ER46]
MKRFLLFVVASVAAWAQTPNLAPDLASNPAAAKPQLNSALPTIHVAGDSTAAKGKGEQQQGWAAVFAPYFDATKVNVVNRARGGRSARTFITEGLWNELLADVKAGDLVLIQFGHNDGSPVNSGRARGSLPGLGEETEEIENINTKKPETVHTYGWYLRRMIADVQAKQATPIVLSLTVRNRWENGRLERGSGRYGAWAFDVAKAAVVPFIDVTNAVADQLEPMGEPAVKALYPQDHTHFNAKGATLHAEAVVAGLKGLRLAPLDKWLSPQGAAVAAADMTWLRLPRPWNPKVPSLFLVGDSTVRNGRGDGAGGQWGWGDYLAPYFDPEKINTVNRAVGGTGIETFRRIGHWDNALRLMKAGDFVLIQFGHNDNPPRGPLPGLGDEEGDREDPKTKETRRLHTWGWYLRQYIAEARAKGVTPIVCSLVPRKTWKDGHIVRSTDSFAGWARQVAEAEKVPFLDLNNRIADRYDELGQEKVNALFADPHTHTSLAGAQLNAEVVVEALKALPENPLAPYLRAAVAK